MPPNRRRTRRQITALKSKFCAISLPMDDKTSFHRLGNKTYRIRSDQNRVLDLPGRVCKRCHAIASRRFGTSTFGFLYIIGAELVTMNQSLKLTFASVAQ